MAESEIVRKLIDRLGQSQRERTPPELSPEYARVDERGPEELLAFVRRFSRLVRHYAHTDAETPAGDWSALFPDVGPSIEAYVEERDGRVPPHLALMLAFLELYRQPQQVANRITARHLDFFYHEVLRLQRRAGVPDRAHLLLELKKGAAPVVLGPDQLFAAGKDATGVERLYAPVGETVLNHARVDSLRSVYREPGTAGTVRFAPIADSGDGLGGALGPEPRWQGFGHAGLPAAEVGFALASPALRLAEGTREITLRVRVRGLAVAALDAAALGRAFRVHLSGAKGWIEPASLSATLEAGDVLQWVLLLQPDAPAVVDYDAALHGYAYATDAPVAQLLLVQDGSGPGYSRLAGLGVEAVQISVRVSGATSLQLESDAGTIDPKKAFLPFGPQPTAGARFMVAYPEALAKKLSSLSLKVRWKDAPASFAEHYRNYGAGGTANGGFTAATRFRDGGGREFAAASVGLFDPTDARQESGIELVPGAAAPAAGALAPAAAVRALGAAGSAWSARLAHRQVLASPVLRTLRLPTAGPAPTVREGFVTLALNRGFLHAEYRTKHVQNVVTYARDGGTLVLLNEPYTPAVQEISLAYAAATAEVRVSTPELEHFVEPDVSFFQVTPFGPMREHGYQRRQFGFLASPEVTLLPPLPHEGELMIGLDGLAPRDGVSLLVQVAEGSADPRLEREPVRWFALCDNYWKALGPDELVLDTTGGLLTSGLVRVVVPPEATTTSSVLPSGRIWLKAAVGRNVAAVSQLVRVAANAVEVRFVDRGNDPGHLERALPAGSIARMKAGLAAVRTVLQPYASFGGRPPEREDDFRARTAERLRHKERCVTAWDYERVVLDAFPGVHRVKCVPHADGRSWTAPGSVLLVVVPDLRNANAVDPLQPRVDAETLRRIEAHVQARAGMQVRVRVRNPRYRKIRLDFRVRFRAGYEFNHYRGVLQQALVRALSPWAFEAEREIAFGGAIYRSVLLDLVEELHFVDYVTEFRMYAAAGDAAVVDATDLDAVRPATPDAILVSDATHDIEEAR
jgi:hypothetical protein